jgi:acetate kinase
MRVLVVNAGSSSLKLSLLDQERTVQAHLVQRWSGEEDLEEVEQLVRELPGADAVGHRVVHGGPGRSGPARIDGLLMSELAALTDLAPLHQPRSLAAIRVVSRLLPTVPAVACFDTAFHGTLPPAAATYALPREWNSRWGLRRYGFHGLSHAYVSLRAAQLLKRDVAGLRVVSCHLGAGASLCAVLSGRSVDTTMGFTPLAGLVMATRSGSVDPGLLLWLLQHGGVPVDELADVLEHRSGLAGLSGTSGDLRDAALAYDVFVHRLAREVAATVMAAGGLDVLVLTGGVGENAVEVRADLADRLMHLGVALDGAANGQAVQGPAGSAGDRDISLEGAAVRTVVVHSREDLQVARQVQSLLGGT